MVNLKTLKYCENLLTVSSEIKQYVKNTIVKSHNGIDEVFPMGTDKYL